MIGQLTRDAIGQVDPQRVAAALDGALTDIRERGWTKGCFMDSHGRVCILGALERQLDQGFAASEILAARKALAGVLGISFVQISSWNDTPGRTVEEVIAALESARRITAPVISV